MKPRLQYTREARRQIDDLITHFDGDGIELKLTVEITILDKEPDSFTGTDMEIVSCIADLEENVYRTLYPYSEPSARMLERTWVTSVILTPAKGEKK